MTILLLIIVTICCYWSSIFLLLKDIFNNSSIISVILMKTCHRARHLFTHILELTNKILLLRMPNPANIFCFSIRLEDVFSGAISHLPRCLQDVFFKTILRRRLANNSWNRLEDVFGDRIMLNWRYLQDILKTSSTPLQQVFTKANVCWEMTHLQSQSEFTGQKF